MELILKTPSISSWVNFVLYFSLIIMLNVFFPKAIAPFQGLFYTQQAYNIPQKLPHPQYVCSTHIP